MTAIHREATEFRPIRITSPNGLDGVTVETALVPYPERATNWQAALVLDGEHGHLITGMPPGKYTLWARITDNPEVIVEDVETITIT
ncbi:hypothetical protein [Arthrobacter sp. Leaf234]|uniref:hypothetical protein n=1 Tax=Arthrobacter sp. Leaf234 TaxID=1736303 RepID=UPI000B136935|nr:hypothetical protein [Arthrobacter sp. Leaf234]